ncbi:hypothetical protein LJR027_003515 [Terrabacter sp. LjRoot27]|uniref:hypothetical protein n=1 Tax=Terrabacter sp. LjRoot27 TaxID=3342306 RepID=UPI003ECC8860
MSSWKLRVLSLALTATAVAAVAVPSLSPQAAPAADAPSSTLVAVATNPYPADSVATGYTQRARWTIDVLRENRPMLTSCNHGNFATDSGHTSDSYHYSGNAGDCYAGNTPGQYPGPIDKDQLQRAANFAVANAGPLKVQQVIWNGRIWTWPRRSEGWRTYTGGSGVVGGHYDHVHVSIARPGDGR